MIKFVKGQTVYDEVHFPGIKGKVYSIEDIDLYNYPIRVKFDNIKGYYSVDGIFNDTRLKIPTLSSDPYTVKFKGFKQRPPKPTLQQAVDWLTDDEISKKKTLNKLIILRDYYNEGWRFDPSNAELKYTIINRKGVLVKDFTYRWSDEMCFKTKEIRDRFFEDQRDLLEIVKPLL